MENIINFTSWNDKLSGTNTWVINEQTSQDSSTLLSFIDQRKNNFADSLFVFLKFYETVKDNDSYNPIYNHFKQFLWESQIKLIDNILIYVPLNTTNDRVWLNDFDDDEIVAYLSKISKIIDLWKISYLYNYIQYKYYKNDHSTCFSGSLSSDSLYHINRIQDNICTLQFDLNRLGIIDDHFGILPAILLENEIINSWILKSDEFVSCISSKIPIYPCDELIIERVKDEIFVKSAKQESVIFAQLSIQKIVDEESQESDENDFYLDSSLVYWIDDAKLLHRPNWVNNFSSSIASDYKWITISKQSSIKEYLWFVIFANLNDNIFLEKLWNHFPKIRGKESSIKSLKWQFWKIKVKYLSHDFEQLIKQQLQIKLLSVNIKSTDQWTILLISTKVCAGLWKHIGTYQFSII